MQWFINFHIFTVKIDYLLEWGECSCVSLQSMVNSNGGDVPQMVNHCTAYNDRYYIFLVFNARRELLEYMLLFPFSKLIYSDNNYSLVRNTKQRSVDSIK